MSKKNLFAKLEKKLIKRAENLSDQLEERHEEVSSWVKEHKKEIKHLTNGLSETVATSAATGILLLASGSIPFRPASSITATAPLSETTTKTKIESTEDPFAILAAKLHDLLPSNPRSLSSDEYTKLEQTLKDSLGVEARATLDGFHLNTNYGYIGGEQHLVRFPGDTLARHVRNASEWAMFGGAGIAPGRGAWGYFPNEEFERYYVVVQTFLSPDWSKDPKAAYDWFRFRKVLVVNPKNGQGVVGVIGDAGPAEWTGKQYGGSPEVMHYLGLAGGPRKGDVLIFFLDDKDNKYPLGPLTRKVTE